MRSNRRTGLIIVNSVAVVAGAVVTIALVRSVPTQSWSLVDRAPPTKMMSRHPPTVEQVVLVPLERREARVPVETPERQPDVVPQSERVDSWSTDVQRTALVPPQVKQPRASSQRKRKVRKKTRKQRGRYTLKSRLAEIAPTAKVRLTKKFRAAKSSWPPAEVALVAIKDEKTVEMHARSLGGAWKMIHRYPVLAASGGAGPKLRRGDKQVPEGIYRISYLNPNSAYHVSLRVSYPDAFDRRMAKKDGRKDLGGDIMIHGKKSSAGCLAMGDPAAEELFVLAAEIGRSKMKLIIAPTDFRKNGVPKTTNGQPKWVPQLYTKIASAMTPYKRPRKSGGLLSFFVQ